MGSNTTPVPASGVSGLDGKFALAQQTTRFQPAPRPIDASEFDFGRPGPKSDTQVLSEWYGTVLAVATDGKSAEVVLAGDTDQITVGIEVVGVASDQTVRVNFGPDGKVALAAIVL